MTNLKDIVFETDRYWVKRVPKGFEVYKTGITSSTRVAVIGYTGDKGLQRAKQEIERREAAVVSHATTQGSTGNRRVWAFLNGEPFSAIVKKGQASDRAVAQSMKRKLGADVTLWPVESTASGTMYRAQWFDPKSETFREAKVEIWMLT
jgi:hypothetical protein